MAWAYDILGLSLYPVLYYLLGHFFRAVLILYNGLFCSDGFTVSKSFNEYTVLVVVLVDLEKPMFPLNPLPPLEKVEEEELNAPLKKSSLSNIDEENPRPPPKGLFLLLLLLKNPLKKSSS